MIWRSAPIGKGRIYLPNFILEAGHIKDEGDGKIMLRLTIGRYVVRMGGMCKCPVAGLCTQL